MSKKKIKSAKKEKIISKTKNPIQQARIVHKKVFPEEEDYKTLLHILVAFYAEGRPVLVPNCEDKFLKLALSSYFSKQIQNECINKDSLKKFLTIILDKAPSILDYRIIASHLNIKPKFISSFWELFHLVLSLHRNKFLHEKEAYLEMLNSPIKLGMKLGKFCESISLKPARLAKKTGFSPLEIKNFFRGHSDLTKGGVKKFRNYFKSELPALDAKSIIKSIRTWENIEAIKILYGEALAKNTNNFYEGLEQVGPVVSVMTRKQATSGREEVKHPGQIIREEIILPNNLKVAKIARKIGVSRLALNNLVHTHSDLSPDMAYELGKEFKKYGKQYAAENLLSLQNKWDLAQIAKKQAATVPENSKA